MKVVKIANDLLCKQHNNTLKLNSNKNSKPNENIKTQNSLKSKSEYKM